MPLDEATSRLAFLLQGDIRRVVERETGRSERGETVSYDASSPVATWESKRGDVIGRWYAELLATYDPKERILRWAWAGRVSQAMPSHADVIAREGLGRSVPQLAMSLVSDLDEADAATLARLGLVVARGASLEVRRGEVEVQYIGLFDAPRPRGLSPVPSHYSVPPPPVARGSTPPRRSSPPRTYASYPPIQEVFAPRTRSLASELPPPNTNPIREPARALFVPVATAVLATLSRQAAGFSQGLFVLLLDGTRRRSTVTIVAVDASGVLRALDPSSELVDAAQRMVEADQADGNGPWRKLAARILPKSDGGATLHVDVV